MSNVDVTLAWITLLTLIVTGAFTLAGQWMALRAAAAAATAASTAVAKTVTVDAKLDGLATTTNTVLHYANSGQAALLLVVKTMASELAASGDPTKVAAARHADRMYAQHMQTMASSPPVARGEEP